jgi:Restriction endonuclease
MPRNSSALGQYGDLAEARERLHEELRVNAEAAERRRSHSALLAGLREQFVEMYAMSDPDERGRRFERLLNDLFGLFDLYPRAAYAIEHEQIDGAFTFDTDDYLVEAKWWATPLEPSHLHVLKAKIETKAKHVLGLFIGVNGFTQGAIEKYRHGTPLVLMDGADLFAILDARICLPEVLERKRRFAAETGEPMLSVSEMLG